MARSWAQGFGSVVIVGAIVLLPPAARATPKPDAKVACVNAYKDGQVHRKNGELILARQDFAVCAQNTCSQVLRKDCVPWLVKVEEAIPSIVVQPSSSTGKPLMDSRMSIDGKLVESVGSEGAIEIDPGAHVVRVEAKGHRPIERSVKLRAGDKRTMVDIKLEPSDIPTSRPIPASAITFAALGVVGFGAFAGFGLHGNALKSDLEACKPACSPARVDEVKRDYVIADAALGVGVVSLSLATVFFLTRPKVPQQTTGWNVVIKPGHAMWTWSGAF